MQIANYIEPQLFSYVTLIRFILYCVIIEHYLCREFLMVLDYYFTIFENEKRLIFLNNGSRSVVRYSGKIRALVK